MSLFLTIKRKYAYFLLTLLLTFSFDQCSKEWARQTLRPEGYPMLRRGSEIPVKIVIRGYWDFRYSENPGSAFGMFRNMARDRMLLLGVQLLVLGAIGVGLYLARSGGGALGAKLGLLAGGALGNTMDRVRFGRVVDFIVWKTTSSQNGWQQVHEWPTFNIADAALVTGVLALSLGSIFGFFWPHGRFSPLRSGRAGLGLLVRIAALPIAAIGLLVLQFGRQAHSLAGFIPIFVGFCLIGAAAGLYHLGSRLLQPTSQEVREVDPRPPVVLLRAFFRDKEQIVRPRHWTKYFSGPLDLTDRASFTFEEGLVDILKERGPVIALGRPGERVQPAGAGREYLPHDDWKARVLRLVSEAGLVALIPDATESMRWELGEMTRIGLERLLIVLPPTPGGVGPDRPSEWYEEWNQLRQQFPFLPAVDKLTTAIQFDRSGRPVMIKAKSPQIRDHFRALSGTLSQTR